MAAITNPKPATRVTHLARVEPVGVWLVAVTFLYRVLVMTSLLHSQPCLWLDAGAFVKEIGSISLAGCMITAASIQ
jgi:hypothetical protein